MATAPSRSLVEIDRLISTFALNNHDHYKQYEIYLFKQESLEYSKIFDRVSINTYFIPVFDFEYLTNELSKTILKNDELSSLYSGIAITSPRSVHALNKTLSENNINPLKYRLPIPIFTFGSKTPELINKYLPNTECIVFDEANDSKSFGLFLSEYLKNKYKDNDDLIPSLLILFGEKHRNELTFQLNKNSINFNEIIVYKTIELNELNYIKNMDYMNKHLFIHWIFFSPNGVDITMRYLQKNGFHIDEIKENIKCGTLGNTTANKLKEMDWYPSFVANKPNPQSLYDSWLDFVNK